MTPALGMVLVAWLSAVAAGMFALIAYASTPGELGEPPANWPIENTVHRSTGRCTLLMFVHPRCPCSRASIRELARAMVQCGDRLDARVYFFQPAGEPDSWSRTDLWSAAARIPGVMVQTDVGAAIANQFNAKTSGYVLLYDVDGRLTFRGGITAGRGHEGDNLGRSAVTAFVRGRGTGTSWQPVFGCPIVRANESCSARGQ